MGGGTVLSFGGFGRSGAGKSWQATMLSFKDFPAFTGF